MRQEESLPAAPTPRPAAPRTHQMCRQLSTAKTMPTTRASGMARTSVSSLYITYLLSSKRAWLQIQTLSKEWVSSGSAITSSNPSWNEKRLRRYGERGRGETDGYPPPPPGYPHPSRIPPLLRGPRPGHRAQHRPSSPSPPPLSAARRGSAVLSPRGRGPPRTWRWAFSPRGSRSSSSSAPFSPSDSAGPPLPGKLSSSMKMRVSAFSVSSPMALPRRSAPPGPARPRPLPRPPSAPPGWGGAGLPGTRPAGRAAAGAGSSRELPGSTRDPPTEASTRPSAWRPVDGPGLVAGLPSSRPEAPGRVWFPHSSEIPGRRPPRCSRCRRLTRDWNLLGQAVVARNNRQQGKKSGGDGALGRIGSYLLPSSQP